MLAFMLRPSLHPYTNGVALFAPSAAAAVAQRGGRNRRRHDARRAAIRDLPQLQETGVPHQKPPTPDALLWRVRSRLADCVFSEQWPL